MQIVPIRRIMILNGITKSYIATNLRKERNRKYKNNELAN